MPDIYTFASYAHSDNEALYGRVRAICIDVTRVFHSISGLEAENFFDVDSISLGDQWRARIDSGLAASTILFAFVSPAYLRSGPCREEVTSFLAYLGHERSKRLVFPLLLVKMEILDRRFGNDELWRELKNLQCLPIDELRSVDPGTQRWMEKVHIIAEDMDAIVERNRSEPDAVSVESTEVSIPERPEEAAGRLERISQLEEVLPEMTSVVEQYGGLIKQYGQIADEMTPAMQSANSFKARLKIANRLAGRFSPVAEQGNELAQNLRLQIAQVDSGMMELLRMIARTPRDDYRDNGTQEFLDSVYYMASEGAKSAALLEGFYGSTEAIKGLSGSLDKAMAKIQSSLLVMIDAKVIFQTWLEEIEKIRNDRDHDELEGL